MQVPVIDKVVINMGIGEGVNDRKKVEKAAADLALIAGQKAVITKARKSIATYKLRDGQAIGCKVTLRKTRMYEFIDRLVNIALPRVRDFRGLNPKSFDGRGNYTIGIKEHIMFPEIDYDKAAESGAWTSRSARRRAPTTRRARCWRHSISRSGSEGEAPQTRKRQETQNGEEEFDREEQPAAQADEDIRRPARAAEGDRARQDQADGGALRRALEACRVAAQFVGDAHPQSLRDDRPAARLLPQASSVAASRCATRLQGPDPGPRQVELVRRIARWP